MSSDVQAAPFPTVGERCRMMAPWLLSLAAASAGALSLDGVERAIAVGAFGAAAVGALLALTQQRRAAASLRAWMVSRENDLSTFADDRAAAVARQFAWAVDELVAARAELRRIDGLRAKAEQLAANALADSTRDSEELRIARARLAEFDANDLETMRTTVSRAEAALQHEERERRNAEKRTHAAEQRVAELTRTLRLVASTVGSDGLAGRTVETESLMFEWTLEYDGTAHSLRLRCTTAGVRPSKARILDATGHPVAETAVARGRRAAHLVLRIPQSVAAAVESTDWSAFRLEVLVDDAWHGAVLVDRGEPVAERQGRMEDVQATRPTQIRIVS